MKGPSLLVAAVTLLSLNGNVLALEQGTPGVVVIPFQRQSAFNRRAGTVEAALTFRQVLYTVDITLGTPPQSVTVQLDTGSSDLVVNSPASNICTTTPSVCGSGKVCKYAPYFKMVQLLIVCRFSKRFVDLPIC